MKIIGVRYLYLAMGESKMKKRNVYSILFLFLISGCASIQRVHVADPQTYNPCEKGYVRLKQSDGLMKCVSDKSICTEETTIVVYSNGYYFCENKRQSSSSQMFGVILEGVIAWAIVLAILN